MIKKGGSPGLVVKGGDSHLEVVSSNPGTAYYMDIFDIILLKNLQCWFEKTKNKQ